MRLLHTKLGTEDITLAATFAASVEFSDRVADPIAVFRDFGNANIFAEQGIHYEPKFLFTVKNLPIMLHIGMKAHDPDVKLSTVQNMVFEQGFNAASSVVMEYLILLIGPQPEESDDASGESEGN